jgi:hypothetical protein
MFLLLFSTAFTHVMQRFTSNQAMSGAAVYSYLFQTTGASVNANSYYLFSNSAESNEGALFVFYNLAIQDSVYENNTVQ